MGTITYSYGMAAAEPDSWRTYDEEHPDPGYFEFDWISARHPDLYHKLAGRSALTEPELFKLVDLTGLIVADIGAGTGNGVVWEAKKAKQVLAFDVYDSVVSYGKKMVSEAGLTNVSYMYGDCNELPIEDNSVDATISSAAPFNPAEAYRILRDGGYIIRYGGPPGRYMGELAEVIRDAFPNNVGEVIPKDQYDILYPPSDFTLQGNEWEGIPLQSPMKVHYYDSESDYGSVEEAAAIYGRIYGPKVKKYILDNHKSSIAGRGGICYGRVNKQIPGFVMDPNEFRPPPPRTQEEIDRDASQERTRA